MRRFLTILLCLTVAISLHARGRALLIGIGDYPAESGWEKINASNDIKLLSKTLARYQITTLQDSKATYNGIKAAFKNFTAECQTGDTVIIHFSCHGQQMLQEIQNTVEEPDMLDEALVPYDANIAYSSSYKGQYHLRDDEFSKLIDAVRTKVSKTGFVLVLLDACHSDTADRSIEDNKSDVVIRGSRNIFGESSNGENLDIYKYKTPQQPITMTDQMSHVVYISACKAHQVNRETVQNGINYGSLSYAFCDTYRTTEISDITSFAQQVNRRMKKIAAAQNLGARASFILDIEPQVQRKETPAKKESAVERLLKKFN